MRFHAKGTFVIDSWDDVARPASPDAKGFLDTMAAFTRTYSGDFSGSGRCQSVTTRSGPDHAAYVGIEIFEGTVQGRTGQFSIIHRSPSTLGGLPWQRWTIGAGEGELAGIQGNGEIVMTDEEMSYSFAYDLDALESEEPTSKKRRKRLPATEDEGV